MSGWTQQLLGADRAENCCTSAAELARQSNCGARPGSGMLHLPRGVANTPQRMVFAARRCSAHGSQGLLRCCAIHAADSAACTPADAGTQRVESARAGTVEHTGGVEMSVPPQSQRRRRPATALDIARCWNEGGDRRLFGFSRLHLHSSSATVGRTFSCRRAAALARSCSTARRFSRVASALC